MTTPFLVDLNQGARARVPSRLRCVAGWICTALPDPRAWANIQYKRECRVAPATSTETNREMRFERLGGVGGSAGAAEGLHPAVPHDDDPLLLPHRLARHRPRRGRPQGLRSRTTDRFSQRPDILLWAPIKMHRADVSPDILLWAPLKVRAIAIPSAFLPWAGLCSNQRTSSDGPIRWHRRGLGRSHGTCQHALHGGRPRRPRRSRSALSAPLGPRLQH